MSLDKSSGSGDQHPDQAPKPEHKPFPGQPGNRPPAPCPTGYRTFEEISAERAKNKASGEPGTGKPGEQAGPGHASARDTAGTAKGPAGAGPGTADTGPRGTAAVPGTRGRAGAVPGNVPTRGEGAGPQSPAPQDRVTGRLDRGPAGRQDAFGGHRPDSLRGTDRPPLRSFPGQPGNRPLAPRPAGYRTFGEISAERAKNKAAADRNPAKPADQAAPGQATTKDASSTAKEAAAARPGTGTTAERGTSAREQVRGGSEQAGEGTARARETSGSADKTSAAQAARRDPGSDRRPGPPAPPDKATPAGHNAHEGPRTPDWHPPGSGNPPHTPDASGAQRDGKGGILHGHAEFHGQKLDLYTDSTRWIGGDAVRAAQAEAALARAEGQPAPQSPGIADIPQMRDLGRNTVGEKEARSPGDTGDLPPTGEELLENADQDKPKMERLKNKLYREIGDVNDAAQNQAESVRDAFAHPQPTGHAGVPVPGPVAAPQEAQHGGASPDPVTQLIVVGGVMGYQTARWVQHKINELTRSHDASHG